jgi:hypothetical protein
LIVITAASTAAATTRLTTTAAAAAATATAGTVRQGWWFLPGQWWGLCSKLVLCHLAQQAGSVGRQQMGHEEGHLVCVVLAHRIEDEPVVLLA